MLKEKPFKRNCPKCTKEISYTTIKNRDNAEFNNKMCMSCTIKESNKEVKKFCRNCPICDRKIFYKDENNYNNQVEKNESCLECKKNAARQNKNFKRQCPKCDRDIFHSSFELCELSRINETLCIPCSSKIGDKKFKRNCPKCDKEMFYKTQKAIDNANNNNFLCCSCNTIKSNKDEKKFFKDCPQCDCKVGYKTKKALENSVKNNTLCRKCIISNVNNDPTVRKKIASKQKGKKHPIKGKTYLEYWTKQYGEEIAIQKVEEMSQKYNVLRSGENNPMYGKERPKGAGNGISGHYKNYYFRSLLELSYLMHLLDNNIKFENAEKKKYRLQYTIDGKNKSYSADFYLIETDELIEIKPKNLTKTKENKAKFTAGREKFGEKYKIVTEEDIEFVSNDLVKDLYLKGELIFDTNKEEKVKKYLGLI